MNANGRKQRLEKRRVGVERSALNEIEDLAAKRIKSEEKQSANVLYSAAESTSSVTADK